MYGIPQILASFAALLGPLVTIIGLVHARGWLTAVGAICAGLAVVVAVYARAQARRVNAASVVVEGISLDAFNAANLRRRVNRTLTIQTSEQFVTIDGADLDMVWRYTGYCHAKRETSLEFSIDGERGVPFDQLDCYAYDLKRDPGRQHKIRPILVGPDSISKKIAVPFSGGLRADDPFDIMLHSRLRELYGVGVGYYTATLSLGQKSVSRSTVLLRFPRTQPEWVRVYGLDQSNKPRLLKNLNPTQDEGGSPEYRDTAENVAPQSVRIYLFKRTQF